MEPEAPSLQEGIHIIKKYVKSLPDKPGVYRMLNPRQQVLYVGKAINLKKRVHSYTQAAKLPVRLQRMVSETTSMEFIVTHSEIEALLLEANLIKNYDPPYNVRLKDDKFFAYIHLSDHPWPRLSKYRGDKKERGQFFGPFVSTGAIDKSLTMLHKIFKLRSCTDTYFKGRRTPCLQYHIKRCSAPCVAYITPQEYKTAVRDTIHFLKGKTQKVQQDLSERMQQESLQHHYEKAAVLRDQIRALTALQAQQTINIPHLKDGDFFALARSGSQVCIQGFFYRNGSNYGTHSFFLKQAGEEGDEDILSAFLTQFYTNKTPPKCIFLNKPVAQRELVCQALAHYRKGPVDLSVPERGDKKNIILSVYQNAREALEREALTRKSEGSYLEQLGTALNLSEPLQRIEVYDNSHSQGTNAIGAMIVSGPNGLDKKGYRKFIIKSQDLTPGDDYAMMREVLQRRFQGSLAQEAARNRLPDLVIIDGGKGQLSAAQQVFEDLDLQIPILAIAKGPERHAGKETFFTSDQPNGFKLEDKSPLLHYLQRLRDEAHRFAITFHRAKRLKHMKKSLLDEIPGIGAARKKALLRHFGSVASIKSAGIKDLENTPGISQSLAKMIYQILHSR